MAVKCPAHIIWLDSLLRAFPDARFVMTHRDPTDVMLSVCDVYADIIGGFTDHLDRSAIARMNVEHWTTGIERVMAVRDGGADGRFYDIDFRAMQADPVGEVEGLYDWLGTPVSDAFAENMRRSWARDSENASPARSAIPPTSVSISTLSARALPIRHPGDVLDQPLTQKEQTMAIDLTGGIDPAREFVFGARPDDPEMRDSVSIWVFDDRGAVGLTRIGVEAVSANWEQHGLQVNLAFPDGRVYRLRADAATWPAAGPDGQPTVLGAGPLVFRCIEPFVVGR